MDLPIQITRRLQKDKLWAKVEGRYPLSIQRHPKCPVSKQSITVLGCCVMGSPVGPIVDFASRFVLSHVLNASIFLFPVSITGSKDPLPALMARLFCGKTACPALLCPDFLRRLLCKGVKTGRPTALRNLSQRDNTSCCLSSPHPVRITVPPLCSCLSCPLSPGSLSL